jgi:hypothetical protein
MGSAPGTIWQVSWLAGAGRDRADRKPVALIVPADLPRLPGGNHEKADDS